MIYRRDRLLGEPQVALLPRTYEQGIAPEPGYDFRTQGLPPTVAVALRPRRAVGLGFAFDADLDEALFRVAVRHGLLHRRREYVPNAFGVSMTVADERDALPRPRTEVLKNGEIYAARALAPVDEEGALSWPELVALPLRAVSFAATAYALAGRPGIEMEVWLALAHCSNRPLEMGLGAYGRSQEAGPVLTMYAAVGATPDGEAEEAGLVGIARDLSRAFGMTLPEDELSKTLRMRQAPA
jgi:hypothetical protein